MMSCGEFEDFIDAYLEGRLSLSERLRFRTHILVCPMCRRYLRRYQRALELGRRAWRHPADALPAVVPDELVAAILAARRDGVGDRGSER